MEQGGICDEKIPLTEKKYRKRGGICDEKIPLTEKKYRKRGGICDEKEIHRSDMLFLFCNAIIFTSFWLRKSKKYAK